MAIRFENNIKEARRNPELNPRVTRNEQIINAYNALTKRVGRNGIVAVSMTELDKLGINPRSGYNTPIGVYAYDFDAFLPEFEETGSTSVFPFQGEAPYINFFTIEKSQEIVDLEFVEWEEIEDYRDSLISAMLRLGYDDSEESMGELEETLTGIEEHFSMPGKALWEMVHEASGLLAQSIKQKNKNWELVSVPNNVIFGNEDQQILAYWKKLFGSEYSKEKLLTISRNQKTQLLNKLKKQFSKSGVRSVDQIEIKKSHVSAKSESVLWNKLFREMYIYAVVDNGLGIIHPNEPAQLVVLDPTIIENVVRIENKEQDSTTDSKEEDIRLQKLVDLFFKATAKKKVIVSLITGIKGGLPVGKYDQNKVDFNEHIEDKNGNYYSPIMLLLDSLESAVVDHMKTSMFPHNHEVADKIQKTIENFIEATNCERSTLSYKIGKVFSKYANKYNSYTKYPLLKYVVMKYLDESQKDIYYTLNEILEWKSGNPKNKIDAIKDIYQYGITKAVMSRRPEVKQFIEEKLKELQQA